MIANLHGLTDEPSTYRQVQSLNSAAQAGATSALAEQQRQARELYIGNVPPGIQIFSLIDKLNDVLLEMGATTMPGKPIVSGWLGGEGQFAFVQVRTVEECNNALALNGYTLEGHQLKVGRPKTGVIGALGNGGVTAVHGRATQFSLDELSGLGLALQPPLIESTKVEKLVLVGAPLGAPTEAIERILSQFGELVSVERIDAPRMQRSSFLFEFQDVVSQRKMAGVKTLVYDRDFPLAVVRQDDAIMAGFIDVQNETFSRGLRRSRVCPTRVLWMVNFPPVPAGLEKELVSEVRDACAKLGNVISIEVLRVPRDRVKGLESNSAPTDSELVVVVELASVSEAVMCARYIAGPTCYYFNEEKFDNKDFKIFEQNVSEPSVHSQFAVIAEPIDKGMLQPPAILHGEIISTEKSIVTANKAKRKPKLAPEDLEIID